MLLSVMIMPISLATEAVVLVGNYTFVPINICVELKHPVWLVCFSWADESGELCFHLSVSSVSD